MSNLGVQLRNLGTRYKNRMAWATRETIIELGSRLVYRSPVGAPETWASPPPPGYVPGGYRGGWVHSAGGPVEGVRGALDAQGEATVSRIRASVESSPPFGFHFITQTVDYAEPIEFEAHSPQAPDGVIRVTMIESVGILNGFAAKARGMM